MSAKNKKNDLSVYKKEETYQGLRNLQKNRCFTLQLQMCRFFDWMQEGVDQVQEFLVVSKSVYEMIERLDKYVFKIKGQCKCVDKLLYLCLKEKNVMSRRNHLNN